MGKNKLDAVNFCKLFDMFGEDAAKETLADVNAEKSVRVPLKSIYTRMNQKKNMQSV